MTRSIWLILAAVILWSGPAGADPITYSSPDTFLASVSGANSDLVFSALDLFPDSTFGQFIGFSSSTPFTSVLVGATTGGTSYTLDDLSYLPVEGMAPVPEPASMVLVAIGLLGAGVKRWTQRGSARKISRTTTLTGCDSSVPGSPACEGLTAAL